MESKIKVNHIHFVTITKHDFVANSPSNLSVQEIIHRIQASEERFRAKYEKKSKAEDEYYRQRYGLEDTQESKKDK